MEQEYLSPGHLACQGCGAAIGMRHALRVLGKNTIVVIPACCWSVIGGPFPYSALKVPVIHTAFETAGATAAGVRAALDIRGKEDVTVLAWAGDGGTFDIGLQALSGAVERNAHILYICYDNEAYMNTGIQRSSATPYGAWTTTTPETHPKEEPKKDIIQIMAAHKIPYAATASVAYLADFAEKLKKAQRIKGSRFIQLLCPCPPGWKMSSEKTIKVARLATLTKVFPLYEVLNGDTYIINVEPHKDLPVKEYFQYQRRFAHLSTGQIDGIQKRVDFEWERLVHKAMLEGLYHGDGA